MKNTTNSSRLSSLDALRGFDMFWIIGGEGLIHEWAKASNNGMLNWMSGQLHHSDWNGFTFYDLIFPLFIFIAGVSMPYSIGNQLAKFSQGNPQNIKWQIAKSLIRRALILLFLGMVVNGLFKWQGYENTRLASVLGRIALACLLAGIIFLYTNLKAQIGLFVGILVGYWLVMALVPVPNFGASVFTKEGNLAAYIDRLFLPGKLHRKVYDPEGLLSTIPAVCNVLLGIFVGQFLRWQNTQWTNLKKIAVMLLAGCVLIVLALFWNTVFPINKIMWTSSFVLCTGGFSLFLMAFFYGIIDVLGYKIWAMPLVWIGMNSITIYLAAHGLFNFESTALYLFGGIIQKMTIAWQPVGLAWGIVIVQIGFMYFLYKQKWFLKV
jgi:predicted acyltransferase